MNVFTLEVLTIASFSNIPERCSGALCNQISLAILSLRPTSHFGHRSASWPRAMRRRLARSKPASATTRRHGRCETEPFAELHAASLAWLLRSEGSEMISHLSPMTHRPLTAACSRGSAESPSQSSQRAMSSLREATLKPSLSSSPRLPQLCCWAQVASSYTAGAPKNPRRLRREISTTTN